jgi:zinc protease
VLKRSLVVAALIGATCVSTQSLAETAAAPAVAVPQPPPMTVEKLDNGLTVVLVPFPSPGIVAYFTLVEAGARDEVEAGRSGYAHLFEHLMFRGTDTVSAEEYGRRIQAMGADDNASTSSDMTVYTTTAPSDALPDLVKLNADRFAHLHVAEPKYKDETGAVLGERNKGFADPHAQMDEALRALTFKTHTYGHTTIGFKHDVEDMPSQYEYSRQFFKRFYTPDDCVVFVVGDFDGGKALAEIKEAYGPWRGKRARTDVHPELEQKKPRATSVNWKTPTDPLLDIAYRIPAMKTSLADTAALATLVAASFGEPSELYQRLIVKDQKLLELEASPRGAETKDPGVLEIEAKLGGKASFDEIIGDVQSTIDSAARGELPAERVAAASRHLLNQGILGAQTAPSLASRLASLTGRTGDVQAYGKYMAALAQVKPEDVARVAKMLTPAHRDVVTLTTGQEPDAKDAAPKKPAKKTGGAK